MELEATVEESSRDMKLKNGVIVELPQVKLGTRRLNRRL